jgi:hypothetical protein
LSFDRCGLSWRFFHTGAPRFPRSSSDWPLRFIDPPPDGSDRNAPSRAPRSPLRRTVCCRNSAAISPKSNIANRPDTQQRVAIDPHEGTIDSKFGRCPFGACPSTPCVQRGSSRAAPAASPNYEGRSGAP